MADKLRFVVGLDFGTSTIKCIVLVIFPKKREHRLVQIDGLPLFPSCVWQKADDLIFGHRPQTFDSFFRSIKVCLRSMACPEMSLPTFNAADMDQAPVLAWALLTYAARKVVEWMKVNYPQVKYAYDICRDVSWNMGVPLDAINEERPRELFLRILYCAILEAVTTPQSPSRFSFSRRRFHSLRDSKLSQVKQESGFAYIENCFIFCEAHVAVNAFLNMEGNIDDGLYFVCDVGAGTTDVAFFRYTTATYCPRQISFYDSSSTAAAGDNFLELEMREAMRSNPSLTTDAAFQLAQQRMRAGQFCSGYSEIYNKIHNAVLAGFRRSLPKERNFEQWKRGLEEQGGAAVFGGGSQIHGVPEACSRTLDGITPGFVSMKKKLPLREMTELHRIAFGLATPAIEFYESWPPTDVIDSRTAKAAI